MKQDYSNSNNDLREQDLNIYDLSKAGYWRSDETGIWYEKVYKKPYRDYKKGELKLYNWVAVEDELAIELLEDGMVPSFAALEAR